MVLFTPGEEAADGYTGYLSNKTITGLYAQEINGAVVMLERTSPIQRNRSRNSTNVVVVVIDRPLLGRLITIRRPKRPEPAVSDTEQLHRGPGLLCAERAAAF